jgi:hypothetical protein
MVLRTYTLTGTATAGKVNQEIAKLGTPSRTRRVLQEIRYKSSLPADTYVSIYKGKVLIFESEAEVNDYLKFPYPANETFEAGDELRVITTNRNGSTNATIKVDIVVDETTT